MGTDPLLVENVDDFPSVLDHRINSVFHSHFFPTIADVALYSYVARAPEGNVDLAAYGKVRDWLNRIEELPGFVPFPRTAAGLRAAQV